MTPSNHQALFRKAWKSYTLPSPTHPPTHPTTHPPTSPPWVLHPSASRPEPPHRAGQAELGIRKLLSSHRQRDDFSVYHELTPVFNWRIRFVDFNDLKITTRAPKVFISLPNFTNNDKCPAQPQIRKSTIWSRPVCKEPLHGKISI